MREGLFAGCACTEDSADSIAVMPDDLRRFASSRNLGLGFCHVRDVVGALSGRRKGIEGHLPLVVRSWAIPVVRFSSL